MNGQGCTPQGIVDVAVNIVAPTKTRSRRANTSIKQNKLTAGEVQIKIEE